MPCIREVKTKEVICAVEPHGSVKEAMEYAKQYSDKELEIVEWIVAIRDKVFEKREPEK